MTGTVVVAASDASAAAASDAIGAMRSTAHTRVLADTEITAMLSRTRLGYHRAVAALASAGNDVVMDYPLSEQWRLADLLETLDGYDVEPVVECHVTASGADRADSRGEHTPPRPVTAGTTSR